jgi:hypothetical protein
MTDLRTAAQQALGALKRIKPKISEDGLHWISHDRAITALKAALEQPEQEPVAWRSQNATPPGGFVIFQQYPQGLADLGGKIEPLYTNPPRREWQGLTDEERQRVYDEAPAIEGVDYIPHGFARAIEAALKEKNK